MRRETAVIALALCIVPMVEEILPEPPVLIKPPVEVLEIEEEPLDYDLDTVLGVIAAEAADQPYEGQMAVAQCIMTTAERRGVTPEEVVLTPGQYAEPNMERIEAVRAAGEAVLIRGERVVDEPIEYFYEPDLCRSDWHESLTFVTEIGDHRFFRR